MTKCSVISCENRLPRYSRHKIAVQQRILTFHKFPKNPNVRDFWIAATGHEEPWEPKDCHYLCSEHFEKECFTQKTQQRTKLKRTAIPTLLIPERSHKERKMKCDKEVYCRVCLAKWSEELPADMGSFQNIFTTWRASIDIRITSRKYKTIAEAMGKISNVDIANKDGFSPFICGCCYNRLCISLRFINDVCKSVEEINMLTNNTVKEPWPKPIQWDKNVNEEVLKKPEEVEIKQEVLSEDERENGGEFSWPGSLDLDIKKEPQDITDMPIQITVNGTITEAQHDRMASIPNGCDAYEDIEYLDSSIKEEPWCDEGMPSDLQSECILCAKDFRTVSGLRAHVIAAHTYKSVKRKTDDNSPPVKKRAISKDSSEEERQPDTKYTCLMCRRTFATSTDLRVHEVCHNKHSCFVCNTKFDSFEQLAAHRTRCKISTNVVVKPKTLSDAMSSRRFLTREKEEIGIRPAPELTLHCWMCDIRFRDVVYLQMHNAVEHGNKSIKQITEQHSKSIKDNDTEQNNIEEHKSENANSENSITIKQEPSEENTKSILEYAVEKKTANDKHKNGLQEDLKCLRDKDSDEVKASANTQKILEDKNQEDSSQDKTESEPTEIYIEIDLNHKYKSEIVTEDQTTEDNVRNKDLEENNENRDEIEHNKVAELNKSEYDATKEDKKQIDSKNIEIKRAKLLIVDMQEINESESETPSGTDDVDSEQFEKDYSRCENDENIVTVKNLLNSDDTDDSKIQDEAENRTENNSVNESLLEQSDTEENTVENCAFFNSAVATVDSS